jgi:hypothetical protein
VPHPFDFFLSKGWETENLNACAVFVKLATEYLDYGFKNDKQATLAISLRYRLTSSFAATRIR